MVSYEGLPELSGDREIEGEIEGDILGNIDGCKPFQLNKRVRLCFSVMKAVHEMKGMIFVATVGVYWFCTYIHDLL